MRWEYLTKRYEFAQTVEGVEAFEGALNTQGRKEWELAACHQEYNPKTKTWSARCVFKRPIPESGPLEAGSPWAHLGGKEQE